METIGTASCQIPLFSPKLGVGIKGTLGDIDPLNKVPFKRARSRVQKGYPL